MALLDIQRPVEYRSIGLMAAKPTKDRQVKVLPNNSSCREAFKYQQILSNIADVVLSFFRRIACLIYNKCYPTADKLTNLREKLAKNRFDALQHALENPEFDSLVEYANQGDFNRFKQDFLKKVPSAATLPEVDVLTGDMYAFTLLRDVKVKTMEELDAIIRSLGDDEENKLISIFEKLRGDIDSIRATDPYYFLRKASKRIQGYKQTPAYLSVQQDYSYLFNSLEKKISQLKLVVERVQQRDSEAQALQMRERLYAVGWTKKSLEREMESIVDNVQGFEEAKAYLLSRKTFGVDESDPIFQAGLFFLNKHLGSFRDRQFITQCYCVTQHLQNSIGDDDAGRCAENLVRNLVKLAYLSPLYQKLHNRQGRSNPYVRLVQELSTTLQMKIPGSREFRKFGAFCLDSFKDSKGLFPKEGKRFGYFAHAMDQALARISHQLQKNPHTLFSDTSKNFSWKGLQTFPSINCLALQKTVCTPFPRGGEKYRLEKHKKCTDEPVSNEVLTAQRNYHTNSGRYVIGSRSIQGAIGANMQEDKTLTAHLDFLKEKEGIHLQQHLGGSDSDSESSISHLLELQQQYPQTLRVFTTPLGGVSMQLEGKTGQYFLSYDSVQEFLLKYAKFAMLNQREEQPQDLTVTIRAIDGNYHRTWQKDDDNGFYVGNNVMNSDQFKLAFEKTAEAFSHIDPSHEDKKRLTRALQVATQGFLTVGALAKTLSDLPLDDRKEALMATFKQTFKQDIDQSLVMSVLTRAYFHLLSEKPLTKDIIQEIIGTVIARAKLVAKHELTLSAYQLLGDLLRLIGANENRVRGALQSYLEQGFAIDSSRTCRFDPLIASAPIRQKRKKSTTEREIFEGKKHYRPLKNSGSYGSIIYFDSKGKKYGVFKSINAPFTIGKKLKDKFWAALRQSTQEGFLPLPDRRQVGAMISERSTYLLDRALGTHFVPKTEIIYAQGNKGSFQHFLHGYREADKTKHPENPDKKDIEKFQCFAILDFLLGNLDRKLDNWMVKMKDKGRHYKDIKMIDNANCFPRGHLPRPFMLVDGSTWSQYAWKGLQIGSSPLTKKAIKLIDSLTDSKVHAIIQEWKRDLKSEYFQSFFGGDDGEVIKAFKDRVKVLRQFRNDSQTNPRPFKEIASYNTYEAIRKYLGHETKASSAQYVYGTVENWKTIV